MNVGYVGDISRATGGGLLWQPFIFWAANLPFRIGKLSGCFSVSLEEGKQLFEVGGSHAHGLDAVGVQASRHSVPIS